MHAEGKWSKDGIRDRGQPEPDFDLPRRGVMTLCLPSGGLFRYKIRMSTLAPPLPLTMFSLKNGVVESEAGQDSVDAFAADFQGLKHFGAKIAEALDLGDPWTGTLQEEDFTLTYAYFGEGTGAEDPGAGVMIGKRALLFELLTKATQPQA